ncbi:MAG: hypothetical protein AAF356_10245 [Planctomycetota bacterium]
MSEFDLSTLDALIAEDMNGLSFEDRERLRCFMAQHITKATTHELRIARGRIMDWLAFNGSWIQQDPDEAKRNESVIAVFIRGMMIEEALHTDAHRTGRRRSAVGRFFQGSTSAFVLTGLKDNWKAEVLRASRSR